MRRWSLTNTLDNNQLSHLPIDQSPIASVRQSINSNGMDVSRGSVSCTKANNNQRRQQVQVAHDDPLAKSEALPSLCQQQRPSTRQAARQQSTLLNRICTKLLPSFLPSSVHSTTNFSTLWLSLALALALTLPIGASEHQFAGPREQRKNLFGTGSNQSTFMGFTPS